MRADDESVRREQERLIYVACTRARDLLVLTELPGAASNSWARIVDLQQRQLPAFDMTKLPPAVPVASTPDPPNLQTRGAFEAEAESIARRTTRLAWLRPSDHDADRQPIVEVVAAEPGDAPETALPVGAGRVRGLVLHKLLEEILTGEVAESPSALTSRAATLMTQLIAGDGVGLPDTDEVAATSLRALRLPGIAELRPTLVPELTLFGSTAEDGIETALSGRADAIAFEEGEASAVVDWKSDIAPTAEDMRLHAGQLRHYLAAARARRGALVYMTPGTVRWVEAVADGSDGPIR
jgi:ATP-dependent exoDNAse (exonuclease V) beta subunit